MAAIDDVRRLSQLDFMFLGVVYTTTGVQGGGSATVWHKGRVQQANDGSFIFRSISQDGTVVGVQLGQIGPQWTSSETVPAGIQVQIAVAASSGLGGPQLAILIFLAQSLPQELT
jgi:hypothetical protein